MEFLKKINGYSLKIQRAMDFLKKNLTIERFSLKNLTIDGIS